MSRREDLYLPCNEGSHTYYVEDPADGYTTKAAACAVNNPMADCGGRGISCKNVHASLGLESATSKSSSHKILIIVLSVVGGVILLILIALFIIWGVLANRVATH